MLLLVIAHRGYSAAYPENTLTSIREALLSTPATGIEIDIHVTKDRQLILQHDENLDRMTDGHGKVEDRPYFGYIDGLKTKGTDEPVALLSQVFDFLKSLNKPDLSLVLDVKDDQNLIVLDLLKEFLDDSNDTGLKIYLGVWRQDFALHARKLFSNNRVLVTLIAEECTIDLINSDLYDAFNLDVDKIRPEIVNEAKFLKKNVLLWTCNTEEQISKAKELKVEAILTDDPFKVDE